MSGFQKIDRPPTSSGEQLGGDSSASASGSTLANITDDLLLTATPDELTKLWNKSVDDMIKAGEIPAPQQTESSLTALNVPLLSRKGEAIYTTNRCLAGVKDPIKVIHVPQTHYPNSQYLNKEDLVGKDLPSDQLDRIASSQHQIALYLKRNPDLIVMDEGQNIALTKEFREQCHRLLPEVPDTPDKAGEWLINAKDSDLAQGAFELHHTLQKFPGGIPENFEELTCGQKFFLALVGASTVSFFLEEAAAVYPSIAQEKLKEISDALTKISNDYDHDFSFSMQDPRFLALIRDVREQSTEVELQSLVNDPTRYVKGDRIAIIYGANHNFSDEFTKDKGYQFEVAEEFRDDYFPPSNLLVEKQKRMIEMLQLQEAAKAFLTSESAIEIIPREVQGDNGGDD